MAPLPKLNASVFSTLIEYSKKEKRSLQSIIEGMCNDLAEEVKNNSQNGDANGKNESIFNG
ncbi:hypothetical protein [Enterobacter roggenkampii]|uniref:hypothetical protein n=1 Tax=Enterobacter roggenkampii TaxID=1812935 RepID=UPI001C7031D7|nr:hypothetical protein [Enterobacter roggenkampii]MBW9467661.1 hypothetical protein [Enterobacter roggenkampii]